MQTQIKQTRAERHANAVAKSSNKTNVRGLARAKRRANGDFTPVNTQASLEQAPQGKYARGLHKAPAKKAAE